MRDAHLCRVTRDAAKCCGSPTGHCPVDSAILFAVTRSSFPEKQVEVVDVVGDSNFESVSSRRDPCRL